MPTVCRKYATPKEKPLFKGLLCIWCGGRDLKGNDKIPIIIRYLFIKWHKMAYFCMQSMPKK